MRTSPLFNSKNATKWAFVLVFFVSGASFWQIPYSEVSVPNAFFGISVIAVFLVALFLAFQFGFKKGLIVSGLVLPAVLMARVFVEAILEPTRHNLWPLALMIVLVLGFIVAGAGATLGWLASRLLRKD